MNFEEHFKVVDFTKNLLFNATTKEQEGRARKALSKLREVEENFIVGG